MMILNSPQVVQQTVLRWKQQYKIAFVPTMGCLHEGHLQLIRKAKELGHKTVVSIFVNPLQFGPAEDLKNYPRPFEEDVEKLELLSVDVLFAPKEADLYPECFCTQVKVQGLDEYLCGHLRPGHFEGVATVCLKLFQITAPDYAVFGEKDFQQLRIIQRMVEDLNLPISIVAHPIVREQDGLAMSSRNRYLSPEERQVAAHFPQAMSEARQYFLNHGTCSVEEIVGCFRRRLAETVLQPDYVEIASGRDLVPQLPSVPVSSIMMPRLFAAVKVGKTRLIDNMSLGGEI
ncbi:MAG: pantoate--beta-alanine ligase [Deltaproteobacteria bacterium]|nr:pantoate--beta-alanine ligase [Deltaproteobacteria bacterium]